MHFTTAQFVETVTRGARPADLDGWMVVARFAEQGEIKGALEMDGRTAILHPVESYDEIHLVSEDNNNLYAHGLLSVEIDLYPAA